jgi:hypothetical protein
LFKWIDITLPAIERKMADVIWIQVGGGNNKKDASTQRFSYFASNNKKFSHLFF